MKNSSNSDELLYNLRKLYKIDFVSGRGDTEITSILSKEILDQSHRRLNNIRLDKTNSYFGEASESYKN